MDTLKAGILGEQTVVVTEEMTALHQGSGELPVLATPKMIALLENTAYRSVMPYLAQGQGTVGTKMMVNHLSATPVGMEIRLQTELKKVDQKRLVFMVKAFDAAGCIGEGEHERFIVDNQKFLQRAQGKGTGA